MNPNTHGIHVDVDIPEHLLEFAPKLKRMLSRTIASAGNKVKAEVAAEYERAGAVATGKTVRALRREKVKTAGSVKYTDVVVGEDRGRIAWFQEHGTDPVKKARMVPLKKIERWMKDKGKWNTLPRRAWRALLIHFWKTISGQGVRRKGVFRKARIASEPIVVKQFEEAARRFAENLSREAAKVDADG